MFPRDRARSVYFALIVTLFLPCSLSAEWKAIVLGTQKTPGSPDYQFLETVYTEIFESLDRDLILQTYPPARASFLSDAGVTDGELSRIHGYGDNHGNLFRVEEPHWHTGFIAITNNPVLELNGWASLKDSPWKVAYMRGVYGCEKNLPLVVPAENLSALDYGKMGFDQLLYGRADIFVIAEIGGMNVLSSEDYARSGLRVAGVLDKYSSHMYLNRDRYEPLAEQVSQALRNMRRNGLLGEYTERAGLVRYLLP